MKKIFFFVVVIVLLMMGAYGAYVIYHGFTVTEGERPGGGKVVVPALTKEERARKTAAWALLKKEIGREIRQFQGTVGIVIKDLDLNWEIVSNDETPIPSASMVKIPIMMAYFYAAHDGLIDLQARVSITNQEKSPGSGLLKNMKSGQDFSVEELINLMITHSDNTAANVLIDRLGMETINRYFLRLGLKHTNLSRKMMDFKSRKGGVENYTTARDMAYCLEKLYRNQFIDQTTSKRCLEILAGQKVNDRIPKRLPGTVTVAHKTGLENGLCHDAGIVYTDKGNFLISVLVKHNNKTAQAAKNLIAKISLLAYLYHEGA